MYYEDNELINLFELNKALGYGLFVNKYHCIFLTIYLLKTVFYQCLAERQHRQTADILCRAYACKPPVIKVDFSSLYSYFSTFSSLSTRMCRSPTMKSRSINQSSTRSVRLERKQNTPVAPRIPQNEEVTRA